MVPGGFPLAEMQVATGVFRLDERATRVGVDRLIWVLGRTERIWYALIINLHLQLSRVHTYIFIHLPQKLNSHPLKLVITVIILLLQNKPEIHRKKKENKINCKMCQLIQSVLCTLSNWSDLNLYRSIMCLCHVLNVFMVFPRVVFLVQFCSLCKWFHY